MSFSRSNYACSNTQDSPKTLAVIGFTRKFSHRRLTSNHASSADLMLLTGRTPDRPYEFSFS